jgi:hypothetical protein
MKIMPFSEGDPPNRDMGTRIRLTTSKGTNVSFSL